MNLVFAIWPLCQSHFVSECENSQHANQPEIKIKNKEEKEQQSCDRMKKTHYNAKNRTKIKPPNNANTHTHTLTKSLCSLSCSQAPVLRSLFFPLFLSHSPLSCRYKAKIKREIIEWTMKRKTAARADIEVITLTESNLEIFLRLSLPLKI